MGSRRTSCDTKRSREQWDEDYNKEFGDIKDKEEQKKLIFFDGVGNEI